MELGNIRRELAVERDRVRGVARVIVGINCSAAYYSIIGPAS